MFDKGENVQEQGLCHSLFIGMHVPFTNAPTLWYHSFVGVSNFFNLVCAIVGWMLDCISYFDSNRSQLCRNYGELDVFKRTPHLCICCSLFVHKYLTKKKVRMEKWIWKKKTERIDWTRHHKLKCLCEHNRFFHQMHFIDEIQGALDCLFWLLLPLRNNFQLRPL